MLRSSLRVSCDRFSSNSLVNRPAVDLRASRVPSYLSVRKSSPLLPASQFASSHPSRRFSDRSSTSCSGTGGQSVKGAMDKGLVQDSLRGEIIEIFKTALNTAYPDAGEFPVIAPCGQVKFGNYQCNNAMGLHGKMKGKEGAPKAPRDVAMAIVAAIPSNEIIENTSLAGPGFINIKLNQAYVANKVTQMMRTSISTWAPKLSRKRAIVDFSSPNVAKEMHVGHLRSTIIGDTISRSLEFCSVDVLRLNHIGDWGTQFGMLIQHMAEQRERGEGKDGDEDVSDLMTLYRTSKQRFDEEEDFKTRAREAVTLLQSEDKQSLERWSKICAASRKEFEAIYERLDVTLQERGESFYNPMLKEVVDDLKEKGVAEISEGATCIFVDGVKVPLIVQKSDGGYGYASTDMAALKQRMFDEKAEWIIYVTDIGQQNHFSMVFGAAKKAGWLTAESTTRVDHVAFGLVLGDDGKRFRTRSGDLVRLVELLDEAKKRAYDGIVARKQENGEAINEAECQAAAAAMGYGAVKYADLKNHRLTNYKFSFDQMLAMQGNTAVYLLYAHARIAGIVRKAEMDMVELAKTASIEITHPKELELCIHLCKFSEAIEDMLDELTPNRLTDYLYDLSEKFNGFYVDCKVVGSPEESSRLLLAEATAVVMRQCFSLLGITPLYKI